MSSIVETIESDFKTALKQHHKDIAKTLRMIKTELQYATIEKRSSLTDEEIVTILSKMVKKRKDAIVIYQKAGRDDHIQDEEAEIDVIERYLPKALGKEVVLPIIDDVIDGMDIVGPKAIGRVMGQVMRRLKGQRVDGRLIRAWVQERLGAQE